MRRKSRRQLAADLRAAGRLYRESSDQWFATWSKTQDSLFEAQLREIDHVQRIRALELERDAAEYARDEANDELQRIIDAEHEHAIPPVDMGAVLGSVEFDETVPPGEAFVVRDVRITALDEAEPEPVAARLDAIEEQLSDLPTIRVTVDGLSRREHIHIEHPVGRTEIDVIREWIGMPDHIGRP